LEGPDSGFFAKRDKGYPEGTTVVTSSSNQNNRMSPWDLSFSALFFSKCRKGYSIAKSFDLAEASFANDQFGGQLQQPRLMRGRNVEESIQGRFFAGRLPDLTAPELVDVRIVRSEESHVTVQASAADDRVPENQLTIEAELIAANGETMGKMELAPVDSNDALQQVAVGPVSAPGIVMVLRAWDTAGNQSRSVPVWISHQENTSVFDLDEDERVGVSDLQELMKLGGEAGFYRLWLFDLSAYWTGLGAQ
jgi:hypothetical protein